MNQQRTTTGQADIWADGAAYESYVGRWSRPVAREFVRWLGVPPGSRWLDVGCGTGALTQAILQIASPRAVKGIDPSEQYIKFARQLVPDDRVTFEIGDAQALHEEPVYHAVVSGLAFNFVPEPSRGVAQMARVVRPGGTVAAYVWDYAGEMQFMRRFWDAAVALDPAAQELDEGQRFPLCQPEALAEFFRTSALRDVAVRAIDVPTVFRDFDDYWWPFLDISPCRLSDRSSVLF